MLKIVVFVCSILSTEQCKTIDLVIADEQVSQMQCMMGYQAQVMIAEWKAAHPNWSVRKWRCEPAGLEQET